MDPSLLKNLGAYTACLDVVLQNAEYNKFSIDQKLELTKMSGYLPIKAYYGMI